MNAPAHDPMTPGAGASSGAVHADIRKAFEVIGLALASVPDTRLEAVCCVLSSWGKERGAAVYLDVLLGLLTGQQHGKTARIYTFPTPPTPEG